MSTPVKEPPTSTFSTPSTKGKGEDIVGYLVAVEDIQKSRRGNTYYMLQIQVSKTELLDITIMAKDSKNPSRAEFLSLRGKPLKFTHVYPAERSGYFYTTSKGSVHEEISDIKDFSIDDIITAVGVVSKKTSGTYHVNAMLKWLGPVEQSNGGVNFRWALLGDVSGSMKLKVWNEKWFELAEQTVFRITNLTVKDFFGVHLGTSFHSAVAAVDEEIIPAWPDHWEDMVDKIELKTINYVEIDSVSLSANAKCPSCNNDFRLTGSDFLDCCDRSFRSKKCKFFLHGEIEVEVPEQDEPLNLTVDLPVIDNIFGEGTVRRSAHQLTELKHRLLQLERVQIKYVVQTKKVESISVLDDVPAAKKSKNDGEG